jgi:hypothetical protein
MREAFGYNYWYEILQMFVVLVCSTFDLYLAGS